MSNRCIRCSEYIPRGKSYCNTHYQQALAEYEEDLQIYEENLQIYEINMATWNSMDDEGRARWDRAAEDATLTTLAGVFGFSSGAIACGLIAQITDINIWLGLLLVATTTTLSIVIKPLRNIVARFTRVILATAVMLIIPVIIVFIVFIVTGIGGFEESEGLTWVLLLAAICITLIFAISLEIKGKLKSSGKPKRPNRPSIPSP